MGMVITTVYRGRTRSFVVDTVPLPMINSAAPETFERWCLAPEWDYRTLEEFAADGGNRIAPLGIDWRWYGQ